MANQIEVIEGFDEMATADVALCYTVLGGSNSIVTGLIEGKAYTMPNGGGLEIAVPANAEYYLGLHWWCSGAGGAVPNGTIIQFREGTTVHGTVAINADGTITISRNGSIPATSAPVGPYLLNIPHWLEVYYKVHDSAGAWEVRSDTFGAIIGPTGSLDTRNAGAVGTIDNIRLAGASQLTLVADNIYCASGSAGFQGEGRVVTDLPTADGTNVAWAASAGSDYQCVDDATQNGDTDYISSAVANDIDTFTMATFGLTGTIAAVAIRIFGRKDDAGARSVKTHIRRAATEYPNGTTHALSTTTAGYQGIWPTDPNTGVAWVDSNIDGAEYGVKNI